MAYVTIPGGQQRYYPISLANPPALATSTSIAATGDKIFMVGPVTKAGNISRVGFRFAGTVTKAGGSGLTVSLQDYDPANGPAYRGDGTGDQTVAIANGNASFAANTWIRTGALSANRTVTKGEPIAVCIEYDGGGRLGADTFNISLFGTTTICMTETGVTTLISGVYAALATGVPNLVLEYDDGSFGTLEGAIPCSAINTHTFKQDTGTADEFLMPFQFPDACKVDAALFPILFTANTSDMSVLILDATGTAVTNGTRAIDANRIRATGAAGPAIIPFDAEVTIAANTQYYLSFRPTQTTSTISVYSADVNDANHLGLHPGGTSFTYSTRLDLGTPAAATTTRRLIAGLRVSSVDTGSSGGGGHVIGG